VAQVKIYGLRSALQGRQKVLSDAIHRATTAVLSLPEEKRFHRFLLLDAEEFFFPPDRSERYTIVEISMFEGRAVTTKKALIRRLFQELQAVGINPQDVEITIFETPRENWGIRGQCGDELTLNYRVEV
jgi:phenylpyruvate tautomerase PptA (4-oxalocrotonate tautomerase family)